MFDLLKSQSHLNDLLKNYSIQATRPQHEEFELAFKKYQSLLSNSLLRASIKPEFRKCLSCHEALESFYLLSCNHTYCEPCCQNLEKKFYNNSNHYLCSCKQLSKEFRYFRVN